MQHDHVGLELGLALDSLSKTTDQLVCEKSTSDLWLNLNETLENDTQPREEADQHQRELSLLSFPEE